MKRIALLTALLLAAVSAFGQEESKGGVPADVYYLLPAFTQGMVYVSGQAPAQGKVNICAEDQTLRFLDQNGQELVASSSDDVLRVVIFPERVKQRTHEKRLCDFLCILAPDLSHRPRLTSGD